MKNLINNTLTEKYHKPMRQTKKKHYTTLTENYNTNTSERNGKKNK